MVFSFVTDTVPLKKDFAIGNLPLGAMYVIGFEWLKMSAAVIVTVRKLCLIVSLKLKLRMQTRGLQSELLRQDEVFFNNHPLLLMLALKHAFFL